MDRAFRRLPIYVLLVILTFAAAAAAQSVRTQPTPTPTPTPTPDDTPERIETEEVKLNILAYDKAGNFFEGLRAEDLVITENDILHQAASLRRLPAHVLIIMDTGGELRSVKSLEQTQKTAAALVASLKPENSVAILQYSDTAEIVGEWTTNRSEANAAIRRTKYGLGSAFLEALELGTEMLTRKGIENRHLVLITDGTDSLTSGPAKETALRRILSTDINVHVISYTRLEIADIEPRTKAVTNTPPKPALQPEIAEQLPNGVRDFATAPKIGPTISLDGTHLDAMKRRKADLEVAEGQLTAMAENTNGLMIIPTSKEEMIEKTAAVARIIDGSYVLTYEPKISLAQMQGERNITVSSRRPGVVVDAKRKLIVSPKP